MIKEVFEQDIFISINELSEESKKSVYDFIEFLKMKDQNHENPKKDKDNLLKVSTWTEKDLRPFEKLNQDINRWKIENY